MPVRVRNESNLRPAEARRLARSAKRMLRRLFPGARRELSMLLLEEEPMREMNLAYRGVDAPTDVLAFPLGGGEKGGEAAGDTLLGDVVLCVPLAGRQAAERGETLMEELEVLTAHGLLHLLGYDDLDDEAAERMRRAENRLLGRSIIG